ncbi:ABC transporter substrate-binding protein [Microlunatus soli]|uniref:Multiple sugar transport system substrate-binding protein n=1 Tax=Microlunatus soli TaxID=630515 RepID=A0A1H1X962_9ACTN|nr:sugar ABC transporter substrate-binding protein [Microlunatus soli]SDT05752.1 multiple sugar transport system substrate-binding protein [Microlunatus soli]
MSGYAYSSAFGRPVDRRTFLRGLGTAALVPAAGATLAGCGSDSGSASGDLTFVYYGDADLQKDYDKLFTKFRKDHPEITLKAQGIASKSWAEFANAVSTRLAGGQPLDVVQIATEGQRIFASKGLLEPLDPYIKKDQAAVDGYYKDTPPQLKEWLKQYASPDGKTYYMPGGYNTMALYVDGKIFSDAGVEVPEEWTWDEFSELGKEIKAKTGAYLTAAGSGYFTDVMPWLLTNGASTLDEKWATATYASPEAVESLTFARSLVTDGLAPKPGGTYDAPTAMSQGKLASFGGGRWPTNDLRRLKALDGVQLVKWPKKTTDGSPVGWDAWPILKGSKNKDAAWTLITYLISESFGDTITTGGGAAVPARISDATSKAFLEDAPENTELLSELLKVATPIPAPDRGAECQKAIEEAWLQGISGTKQPQQALTEANTKIQGLLA